MTERSSEPRLDFSHLSSSASVLYSVAPLLGRSFSTPKLLSISSNSSAAQCKALRGRADVCRFPHS